MEVRLAPPRRRIAKVQLLEAAVQFTDEDSEGGKRGQALAAAAFDLVFDDVRMGRINDPSRRFPGDVQGHAFAEPTVRFYGERSEGFRALASLYNMACRLAIYVAIGRSMTGSRKAPIGS